MMMMQDTLALLSGSVVGLVLGLVGGGGSILAVPLLIRVVGVKPPHVAIGTSAVAVTRAVLDDHARHLVIRHATAPERLERCQQMLEQRLRPSVARGGPV